MEKYLPAARTSYANEPMATSRRRRCLGLEMRSDKPDKSMTREKKVPRLTHDSHKSDKLQPFPKEPRYERYTPLTANRTTILEEAFNVEVPVRFRQVH